MGGLDHVKLLTTLTLHSLYFQTGLDVENVALNPVQCGSWTVVVHRACNRLGWLIRVREQALGIEHVGGLSTKPGEKDLNMIDSYSFHSFS